MELRPHVISATEVHDTGDRIPFDAVDWFLSATEQQIRDLRTSHYRVIYCELIDGQVHCPGVEVIVDENEAEVWLATHRPEVLQSRSPLGEDL
jgi:hypothetical protein